MRIRALSASNFMSFRTLNFSVPDTGLHFVGGEVTGKTMSNSNGAGKSALFEALCFGLYGKTIRNAGKDDVINRTVGKDCVVAVEVESDGHEYSIFRFRGDSDNGNELRLMKGDQDITAGNMSATQDMLDQILGMNWLVFSNAVVFGEKARRFTQARDSEKKEIFDEILLLHQYVEAQASVKDDHKSMRADLEKHNQDVELILLALKQHKDSYEEEEARLVETKEKGKTTGVEIDRLRSEIKEAEGGFAETQKNIIEFEKDKKDIVEANDELYKTVSELTEKKNATVRKFRGVEDSARVVFSKLSDRQSIITKILNSNSLPVNVRCPSCNQPITEESIEEVIGHYTEEQEGLQVELEDADKALKLAEADRVRVEKEAEAGVEEVINLRHEYDIQLVKIEDKIDVARLYERETESLISARNNTIELMKGYLEKSVKDIETRMEDTLKKMEPLQDKLLGSEKSIQEISGELEYLEFWIEGFGNKGIKSFLLDEVVPELNSKANYYASMLMDDEVQVEFKTESTLKSGESRDKFNVSIVYDGEEVSYDNCSSGEKGRIDVSILLALQNLIFSRNANNSNLVIFDEVFEHLDITGVERVVNLLKEEAKNKAILVISHQNELRDYFDNQIIITKGSDGISRIEV